MASPTRAWTELRPDERHALEPLAGVWDRLPSNQREKLLEVARGFQDLDPRRQKLLHARLGSWARMTPEERRIARDNYRKIQSLPRQDHAKISQQWLDSLCKKFGEPNAPTAR